MKITLLAMAILSSALMAKTPNMLAYEKVLQAPVPKLLAPPSMPNGVNPPPPLALPAVEGTFNVLGTMSINGKTTAWLLNKDNKVIRAGENVRVDGKQIDSITQYGVSYHDIMGTGKGFMPIMTTLVNENDVVFSTRENNQQNQSSQSSSNNSNGNGR